MFKRKKTISNIEENNSKSDRVAEFLGLPQGALKNFPSIQIRGNREIIIDGCTGLLNYSGENILIETKYCRIKISGRSLNLTNLTKKILAVRGFIQNVEFNL